jgi:hypothetical protein
VIERGGASTALVQTGRVTVGGLLASPAYAVPRQAPARTAVAFRIRNVSHM